MIQSAWKILVCNFPSDPSGFWLLSDHLEVPVRMGDTKRMV